VTPWSWWWLEDGDEPHGGWRGDCDTRAKVIGDACRHLPAGTGFEIVEARSSEAREYEEAECVPFLRTRNRESLVASCDTHPKDGESDADR
jgi:hypothetical protein